MGVRGGEEERLWPLGTLCTRPCTRTRTCTRMCTCSRKPRGGGGGGGGRGGGFLQRVQSRVARIALGARSGAAVDAKPWARARLSHGRWW